jgi:transposase InsO family protein
MSQALHSQARTTHLVREEIRRSTLSQRELAERYHVSRLTIRKWQRRDDVADRSHRPHRLHTTLGEAQEALVVAIRTTLLLPTDDLLAVTRQFIHPRVSRSGLGRCLRRHGVADLAKLAPVEDVKQAVKKSFKDYVPGFIHVDIKYLPQMPDETERSYLFVAIDRATRWVFFAVYPDQSENSSADFLGKLHKACPVKITKLLTDNGSQFTDRFTSGNNQPSGKHLFDRICDQFNIEHRLIRPRHPQTNGMVERYNGRISELTRQTRFDSAAQLQSTLRNYREIYNHHIPQRALKHQTPIQALKSWQQKNPELFVKRVYDHAGLDT